MKGKVFGFIFARGGSKGVPFKNIRNLGGKPLIAHAIEKGLQSSLIDRVIVSTDSEEIAEVAVRYGAEVPFMRPAELALDDSHEWQAWRHAVQEINKEPENEVAVFVSLPTTSPFRSVEDIDRCIRCFFEGGSDVVITVKSACRHPSFNMVTLDRNFNADLLMPLDKKISRRQDAPLVYDMTTVAYVTSPDFILQADSIFDGKVRAVIVPEDRGLDIDTEQDFAFAEFLISQKMNTLGICK